MHEYRGGGGIQNDVTKYHMLNAFVIKELYMQKFRMSPRKPSVQRKKFCAPQLLCRIPYQILSIHRLRRYKGFYVCKRNRKHSFENEENTP
jgi:hypothetical protein